MLVEKKRFGMFFNISETQIKYPIIAHRKSTDTGYSNECKKKVTVSSMETIKPKTPESNWQYSVGHCAQRKVHSRAAAIAKDRADP